MAEAEIHRPVHTESESDPKLHAETQEGRIVPKPIAAALNASALRTIVGFVYVVTSLAWA